MEIQYASCCEWKAGDRTGIASVVPEARKPRAPVRHTAPHVTQTQLRRDIQPKRSCDRGKMVPPRVVTRPDVPTLTRVPNHNTTAI